MEIRYADRRLERLASDAQYSAGFDRSIVKAFRKTVGFIAAAGDERDIRSYKALRLEKLKGRRSHQHSMRLNDQFRLIVEIRAADPKNIIIVISIEDYH